MLLLYDHLCGIGIRNDHIRKHTALVPCTHTGTVKHEDSSMSESLPISLWHIMYSILYTYSTVHSTVQRDPNYGPSNFTTGQSLV